MLKRPLLTPLRSGILQFVRTATKRVSGSKTNNRDSKGRRLGPKKLGEQAVKPGAIIMRQRGTKFHPGENVGMGRDHTIYALIHGFCKYYQNPKFPHKKFIGVTVYRGQTLPSDESKPRIRQLGMYVAGTVNHESDSLP